MRRALATMIRSSVRFLYALAMVAAVSCKGTEPLPTLTGSWSGSTTDVSVGLELIQSSRQISGSVLFHDLVNDALGGCEASGTYVEPSVALNFSCGTTGPSRFDGHTTDARSMTGTIVWGDGRQYSSFTFALTTQ